MILDDLLSLWRSARGCCLTIVIVALLLILGSCILLGWGVAQIGNAEAAEQPGLDVMLVIDQSGSLWDLGGVGSDPELLRMEGARLFASYLGVDGAAEDYRLGVVYFGTHATQIAPLTSLVTGDGRQAVLTTLAEQPQAMGWTDVNVALDLAYRELFESQRANPDHATALVLFTDGRPQTEALGSLAAGNAYLAELARQVARFTDRRTAFFTVLLGNEVTDIDPLTQTVYRPMWIDLAEAGVGVRFYDARASQDLPAIYHDAVVQLQRSASQGTVLNRELNGALALAVAVPDGWQRASFVIHKSDAGATVRISDPDGLELRGGASGVERSGAARYEVWTVSDPRPGQWLLEAVGEGVVTVWLDYLPAPPTATPTATATATATPSPTATPTTTATPTPSPTATATITPLAVRPPDLMLQEPVAHGRYRPDKAIAVLISLTGGDPGTIAAALQGPGLAEPLELPLELAEGAAPNTVVIAGEIPPLTVTGAYTLTVAQRAALGRGVILEEAVMTPFAVQEAGPAWGWRLFGAAMALGGGSGGLWWLRRRRPLLDGSLRLVAGPAGQVPGQIWELGHMAKSAVTLGSARQCEVVLPDDAQIAPRAARIELYRNGDEVSMPLLVDLGGKGSTRIEGKPIGRRYPLSDGDVIKLGAYQLRYENLALRRRR